MELTNFDITEQDGLRLINPNRTSAVSNYAWTTDNLWLRSRVETLDGKTVSQGFGKFFNMGMGPNFLQCSLQDIVTAITHNDAWGSIKLDGSLLIRSVYNGQVMLRTRGSFGYDHLDNGWEVDQIFKVKYPMLFEYRNLLDDSILLEWTTPNNTIVMPYKEPELTIVGGVNHSTMRYLTFSELEVVSDILGIPLVRHWRLDSVGLSELMATLTTDQRIEGYVIRINHEQTLVKVKCDSYLARHRLKSNLTTDTLADIWFTQGCPSYTKFVQNMTETYDEETVNFMLPVVSALIDGTKVLNKIVCVIEDKVRVAKEQNILRKDFAISRLAEYGQTKKFSLCMSLYSGRIDNTELLKGILLQNTRQTERGMFGRLKQSEES